MSPQAARLTPYFMVDPKLLTRTFHSWVGLPPSFWFPQTGKEDQKVYENLKAPFYHLYFVLKTHLSGTIKRSNTKFFLLMTPSAATVYGQSGHADRDHNKRSAEVSCIKQNKNDLPK